MSIKTFYIYALGRSCYALSENGIVYYAMTYCFGGISIWKWGILLNFCWVSIFYDLLIANISRMVAWTPINYTIFWKSVMKTFRCIYVNCFSRLRFLAEVSTELLKMHFFGEFTGRNSRSRQITTFFSSIFSALTVCKIHFLYLKLVNIHFHVVLLLVHSGL